MDNQDRHHRYWSVVAVGAILVSMVVAAKMQSIDDSYSNSINQYRHALSDCEVECERLREQLRDYQSGPINPK